MPDKVDDEITVLLTKLYTLQEEVGAREKTSAEEKKMKAQNVQTMGKSGKAKKTGSRFLELKLLVHVRRTIVVSQVMDERME